MSIKQIAKIAVVAIAAVAAAQYVPVLKDHV